MSIPPIFHWPNQTDSPAPKLTSSVEPVCYYPGLVEILKLTEQCFDSTAPKRIAKIMTGFYEYSPHLLLADQTDIPASKLGLLVETVLLCWAGRISQTNRAIF